MEKRERACFAAGCWEEKCTLMCNMAGSKVQCIGKYAWGGGLKLKAPGAEGGCKNALFVAGVQCFGRCNGGLFFPRELENA